MRHEVGNGTIALMYSHGPKWRGCVRSVTTMRRYGSPRAIRMSESTARQLIEESGLDLHSFDFCMVIICNLPTYVDNNIPTGLIAIDE